MDCNMDRPPIERGLQRLQEIQPRIHGLAVGMTLGLGTMLIGQVCPAAGQCAACGGACAARLPWLALPLLADGALVLAGKVLAQRGEPEGRSDQPDDTRGY